MGLLECAEVLTAVVPVGWDAGEWEGGMVDGDGDRLATYIHTYI